MELLAVMAVISVLVGMSMPLLSFARRQANRTNTTSLMRKVDGGLRLFRIDHGGFPYREWSEAVNPPPASNGFPPENLLAYHLCHDLSDTERTNLQTDVDAAGNAYEVGGLARIPSTDYNAQSYTSWTSTNTGTARVSAFHLNRLARQWARTNVMIGNVEIRRTVKSGSSPWIEGGRILTAPTTKGCAIDYLSHDIPVRNRANDAILDLWGNPLIYICPVQPGVVGYFGENIGSDMINTAWFGFSPRSRRTATTALDSDMRATAGNRFVFQYELWSAGPDGLMTSLRTEAENRDNIQAEDYLRDLR